MKKIQRDSILQARNERLHIRRVQIHPQQLVPVAEDNVRRRVVRTLAREAVVEQLIPLEARALVARPGRDAPLRARPPGLARVPLQAVHPVGLQVQPRGAGADQALGRVVAAVRAHQAEVAEALVAAQALVRAVRAVRPVVAELGDVDALPAVVALPGGVVAFRGLGGGRFGGAVDGLVVAVQLVLAVHAVDVRVAEEFLGRLTIRNGRTWRGGRGDRGFLVEIILRELIFF